MTRRSFQQVRRWSNVPGCVHLELDRENEDGEWFDIATECPANLPAAVYAEIERLLPECGCCYIEVHFLATGYWDEGDHWTAPPCGDEERTLDYVQISAGAADGKGYDTKAVRFAKPAADALFEHLFDKINDAELDTRDYGDD